MFFVMFRGAVAATIEASGGCQSSDHSTDYDAGSDRDADCSAKAAARCRRARRRSVKENQAACDGRVMTGVDVHIAGARVQRIGDVYGAVLYVEGGELRAVFVLVLVARGSLFIVSREL